MITLELPWPPSVNDYWRPWRGRMVVTGRGKKYKEEVFRYVFRHELDVQLADRLIVHITLCAPTKRECDLDNFNKCLLDALTEANVWNDDSQIDDLRIERGSVIKGGLVLVSIDTL